MPPSQSAGPAVLTIVCPGFTDVFASEPTQMRSLERLAAYADKIEKPYSHGAMDPWQSELLDALALDVATYPSAPVTWFGATGERITGTWVHADPVFLTPSAQGVELRRAPSWTVEQLDRVTSLLSEHLAVDGMTWHVLGKRSFIHVPGTLSIRTASVQAAAHTPLVEALPVGTDATRLRQAMNEAQMLLHEKLGANAPNGIWLWGAGQLPDAADRSLPTMWTDDDFARGVYRLHGASHQCLALPDALDEVLRSTADVNRMVVVRDKLPDALEAAWFASAQRALDAGHVRRVNVCLDGWRIHARRSFLRRWFASPRALQEILQ